MKLDEQNRQIISNVDNSHEFKIQNNAKMFQILSDKIYTYKIAAIVREISCNAYDSHIEAGIPDVPFKVVLPNELNSYFEIQDFGVGLDEEQVYNIYTMYGASTKSNSNDLIGAFGLGSKTPFAYTTSFTIETRKDGMEYLFNAYIGDNGAPTVSLLRKRETTEGNGVRIKVPVKAHQRDLFRKECEFILGLFPTRPIVIGNDMFNFNFNLEDVQKINEGEPVVLDTSKVKSELYQYKKLYAVMGNVAYPVNLQDIKDELGNDTIEYLDNMIINQLSSNSLFVKFDIGDLDVSASRESLSIEDGKKTKFNLVSKFKEKINELKSIDEKEFNSYTHPLHAIQFIEKKYGGITNFLSGMFKYGKKTLHSIKTRSIRSPYNEHFYLTTPPTYYYHKRSKTQQYVKMRMDDFVSFDYILFTKKEENTKGLDKYMRSLSKDNLNTIIIYIPNLTNHKIKRYAKLIGKEAIDIQYLEDLKELDKKERVKKKYVSNLPKKKSTEISAVSYKVFNDSYRKYNFSRINIDDIPSYEDVVYIDSNDQYITVNVDDNKSITFYINNLQTVCRITGRKLLLICKNTRNSKSIEENNVQSIEDYIKEFFEEYTDTISLFKTINSVFTYDDNFKELIFNNLLMEAALRNNSVIIDNDILDIYKKCKDTYNKYNEIIYVNSSLFDHIRSYEIDTYEISDDIKKQYPMTSYIGNSYYGNKRKIIDEIIDYMNLVDNNVQIQTKQIA